MSRSEIFGYIKGIFGNSVELCHGMAEMCKNTSYIFRNSPNVSANTFGLSVNTPNVFPQCRRIYICKRPDLHFYALRHLSIFRM